MRFLGNKDFIFHDNTISTELSDKIENITKTDLFKYTLLGNSVPEESFIENKSIYDSFFFSTNIIKGSYLIDSKEVHTEYNLLKSSGNAVKVFTKLFSCISAKINYDINPTNIIRAKVNIQTKADKRHRDKYCSPHIDQNFTDLQKRHPEYKGIKSTKYFTVIYYVDSNDGFTYLFDKKLTRDVTPKDLKNLSVIEKNSSIKGSFLLVDGNVVHAGSYPIESDLRTIININVLYDEKWLL